MLKRIYASMITTPKIIQLDMFVTIYRKKPPLTLNLTIIKELKGFKEVVFMSFFISLTFYMDVKRI